ncbi:hypothetical protein HK405_010256, partial [Cladochytrium tenue]
MLAVSSNRPPSRARANHGGDLGGSGSGEVDTEADADGCWALAVFSDGSATAARLLPRVGSSPSRTLYQLGASATATTASPCGTFARLDRAHAAFHFSPAADLVAVEEAQDNDNSAPGDGAAAAEHSRRQSAPPRSLLLRFATANTPARLVPAVARLLRLRNSLCDPPLAPPFLRAAGGFEDGRPWAFVGPADLRFLRWPLPGTPAFATSLETAAPGGRYNGNSDGDCDGDGGGSQRRPLRRLRALGGLACVALEQNGWCAYADFPVRVCGAVASSPPKTGHHPKRSVPVPGKTISPPGDDAAIAAAVNGLRVEYAWVRRRFTVASVPPEWAAPLALLR